MQLFRLRDIRVTQQPDEQQQRGTPYHYLPIDQFTSAAHLLAENDEQDTFYYQLRTERHLLEHIQHGLHFFDLTGKPADNLPALTVACEFLGYHEHAINLAPGTISVTQEVTPSHLSVHNITSVTTDYPPMILDNPGWPLLSGLASAPMMLFATENLKQFLSLFDRYADINRPLSRQIRQHIDGILHVEESLTDRLKQGRPVRGRKLSLTLNPDCYRNPGEMYRFCRLINQVIACFISHSSFVLLEVFTPHNHKALWEYWHVDGLRPDM
ncbi:type VI secretion system baseplate subunit TssF [Xenorhabdus bovienii]|uniref:type VI secretion system baseplate subunit TssF n=1 Tax=Xenorhabdus bovienii TaxID=40576 RepID=UPI003DA4910E